MVQITDRAQVSSRKRLPNGMLLVDATLARTGIQEYLGHELGLSDERRGKVIRVLRDEADVFDAASIASFSMVPVTDDHPPVLVTADNAKQYTVGWAGETPVRDGDLMKSKLLLSDAGAISKLEGGKKELSNGYGCDIDWTSGVHPVHGQFDARQTNIRGNHVAIVPAGRCGDACRIQDGAPVQMADCAPSCNCKGSPTVDLKTITFDGLTFQVNDAAAQLIDKLKGMLATSIAALDTANQSVVDAQSKATKDLEAKDGEIAALKAQILTPAQLDAAVEERNKVFTDAHRVAGKTLDTKGKTVAEVRRAAVAAKLGDAAVTDKSDDYVQASFDTLLVAAPATTDGASRSTPGYHAPVSPLNDVRVDTVTDEREKAHTEDLDRMQNAWRTPAAAAA